jgi:hypothetical protein
MAPAMFAVTLPADFGRPCIRGDHRGQEVRASERETCVTHVIEPMSVALEEGARKATSNVRP